MAGYDGEGNEQRRQATKGMGMGSDAAALLGYGEAVGKQQERE